MSACDSPIQNNISNHVVLQCSIYACILTNDNILRRQLIHKQQHERKCIACVYLHLMIDACQCVTCATMKHREDFSYQQWRKPNNAKKCLSCVQHLMSDGCPAGRILIREHAMSNRLVDGKLHYVPGKKVKDSAACPSAKDKKEAQQGLYSFDYRFQLAKNSVLSISNLGFDIILDSSGVLVGARCSKSIPNQIGLELLSIYNQMESHCPFFVRGKQVANVCANFVVSGLKEDQNTKLKMSHAPKNERTALMEKEMRSK